MNNVVRLLTLPEHLQQRIIAGEISAAAGRELVAPAKDPELLAEIEAQLDSRPEAAAGDGTDAPAPAHSFREVAAVVRSATECREAFNRSASRLDSPGLTPAALAAFRGRWVEELLQREIERRGPEGVLTALGVHLADVLENRPGPAFHLRLLRRPQQGGNRRPGRRAGSDDRRTQTD